MKNFRMVKRVMATTIAAAILGFGSLASATVIGGTSDAYNAYVGVSALGLNVGIGPVTSYSNTAPGTYDDGTSLINATVAAEAHGSAILPGLSVLLPHLNLNLGAGLLNTHGASDVTGAAFAQGDQSIANLNVGLLAQAVLGGIIPRLGTSSLSIIHADLISTQARVEGDYDAFTAEGFTRILGLSIFGQDIVLSNFLNAAGEAVVDAQGYVKPNTTISLDALGLADLTLILNKQTLGGDGTSTRSLEVEAIDLAINGHSLLTGVLNSDIVIGHSYAALWGEENPEPVPEPSTFALIGSGLTGLFFWRRRAVKA